MLDRGLDYVNIHVHREQQHVAAERHRPSPPNRGNDGGINGLQPHPRVGTIRSVAPILEGRRVSAMPSGRRSDAPVTPLYR